MIGQAVRARVCYDRRRIYAGHIIGPADGRMWIDDVQIPLFRLRVTNKPTVLGYVLVYQEDGQWLCLMHRYSEPVA